MNLPSPAVRLRAALDDPRHRVAAHLPGDAGYDEARRPWNLATDQHPAAVVHPETAADVARAVRVAAGQGLRVAVQATGHNPGPLGDLGRTLLLRTHRIRQVRVDPAARRVRAGAGALWDDVVTAVAPHGLTVLHGSSPDVGVAGYTLGGASAGTPAPWAWPPTGSPPPRWCSPTTGSCTPATPSTPT